MNFPFIFIPRMSRYFLFWSQAGKWVGTCIQNSHGKIGKQTYQAEPWTLEIISYWSAFLESTGENCNLQIQSKNAVLFVITASNPYVTRSRASRSPRASPRPTSPRHVILKD